MGAYRIELFSRRGLRGRRHYFRIAAANGKTVAQSEGYSRAVDCLETARALIDNLGEAEIHDG